ncbi:transposase [Streptomyces sp. BE20]|uniref:transposase n=1 Tax=Streptomyces sp. BE20 TaxID=3002525 RepID=UPI003FA7B2D2
MTNRAQADRLEVGPCRRHRPRGHQGLRAGKKVKGCKRLIVTDPLGLLVAVHVATASDENRDGARRPLRWARLDHLRIQKFWTDQGFAGHLAGLYCPDPRPRAGNGHDDRVDGHLNQCGAWPEPKPRRSSGQRGGGRAQL